MNDRRPFLPPQYLFRSRCRCHCRSLRNLTRSCFRPRPAVYGICSTLDEKGDVSIIPGCVFAGHCLDLPFELFFPCPSLSTTSSAHRIRLSSAGSSCSPVAVASARSLKVPEVVCWAGVSTWVWVGMALDVDRFGCLVRVIIEDCKDESKI